MSELFSGTKKIRRSKRRIRAFHMSLLQTFKQALPLSITLLAKRKKNIFKALIQLLNSSVKSCWKWARTLKRYLLSCLGNLFINFEQFKHIISASLLWSLNMILSGRYHWITKVKVILKYLQDSSMQLIFEVLIINTKFMNWAIAWMCSKLTTETLKQHKPSFYKTWKQQKTKGYRKKRCHRLSDSLTARRNTNGGHYFLPIYFLVYLLFREINDIGWFIVSCVYKTHVTWFAHSERMHKLTNKTVTKVFLLGKKLV